MKWLTLELIKTHSRIDFDIEDSLLEFYANSAEQTVLNFCQRTLVGLMSEYGEVPAPLVQASLLLVELSYQQRSPVSAMNMAAVPYSFELLVRPYMLLSGDEDARTLLEANGLVIVDGDGKALLHADDIAGTYELEQTGEEIQRLLNEVPAIVVALEEKADKSDTYNKREVNAALDGKVDKETGKGLSSNDFTTTLRLKLQQLPNNAQLTNLLKNKANVSDVEALETAMEGKASIGALSGMMSSPALSTLADGRQEFLANVNSPNTPFRMVIPAPADVNKAYVDEQLAQKASVSDVEALDADKVDKETGKGLSSQDFTTALKTKLSQLPTNTELTNLLKDKADASDVEALETAMQGKADKAGVMFNPAQSTFADNTKELLFQYYDASQVGGTNTMRVNIPAPQVQADWEETSSSAKSYIANKPTIYTQAEIDELLAANGLRQLFLRSDFRADSDPNKCRYNSATGYYEMNGISDLTEDDMWKIYRVGEPPYQAERFLSKATLLGRVDLRVRTTFPTTRVNFESTLRYGENQTLLEVLCLNPLGSFVIALLSGNPLLVNAAVLHTIIGTIDCVGVIANAELFRNCPMLKNVRIDRVNKNITVTAPKMSYDSMAYMVAQATNTSAITIKVAAETYSYLTGTATPPEDVGGTSEQWQALASEATSKNISFAE